AHLLDDAADAFLGLGGNLHAALHMSVPRLRGYDRKADKRRQTGERRTGGSRSLAEQLEGEADGADRGGETQQFKGAGLDGLGQRLNPAHEVREGIDYLGQVIA